MPNTDRKQRQFESRERDILAAALALCSTPEWEKVTIGQIAKRAEVGKGTLYSHFASKDELLFRLMMMFYQGLLERLRGQTPSVLSPEQLRLAIERALDYYGEHKDYRYVVEYCQRCDFKERADPGWKSDFLQLDRAFMAWAEPILNAGMEQGLIERRPINELMLGIDATFKGAVSLMWAGPDWCPLGDQEVVIAAVTDFILSALMGRRQAGAATITPGSTALSADAVAEENSSETSSCRGK